MDNHSEGALPPMAAEFGSLVVGDPPYQERTVLAKILPIDDDDGFRVEMSLERTFVTLREAAGLLNVSNSTVRHLLRKKKLETRQIGDETQIVWSSLLAFIELGDGLVE